MSADGNPEDLLPRRVRFAKETRAFIRSLKVDLANVEDSKQLIKSLGSIGANYIEAQEALSKKDFVYRCKVSRKESRESAYWLTLINTFDAEDLETERKRLLQEAVELKLIFNAFIKNSSPD